MHNHQRPRIRCRIRELAANLLSICLLSCSSRDLQKLRLLRLYMSSGAKVVQIERNTKGKLVFLRISEMQPTFEAMPQSYLFPFTFRYFLLIILWTHTSFLLYGFMRIICLFGNYS